MGGNNNITVAIPGKPNWDIWWQWHGFGDVQLDIVGLLAVLGEGMGEGAVLANAQVGALSRLFYLPRLLPAPQALIRTTRPTTLPPVIAKVIAVHSGNFKDSLHHVANLLFEEQMPAFAVRCVKVQKKPNDSPKRMDITQAEKASNKTPQMVSSPIKAKATGPHTWVALIGFLEAIILFAVSIMLGDGMSILATIALASLSTVVGIINKWSPRLGQMTKGSNPPPGDAVILYPNGSYLVVLCGEDVARELYFAPEEIEYGIQNPLVYRMLSLLGTILLMLGIVFLSNAKLQLQFAWAGGYIIINIVHWIAAGLPQRYNWDLSCYEVEEQDVEGRRESANFTEALWKAILLTKSTNWVKTGAAAPRTKVWEEWLVEAEKKAKEFDSRADKDTKSPPLGSSPLGGWDAKMAWNALNEAHKRENPGTMSRHLTLH